MGYRGCLGIIRLAAKYSAERMESAAERALLTGACRYQSVKSTRGISPRQLPTDHSMRFRPAYISVINRPASLCLLSALLSGKKAQG